LRTITRNATGDGYESDGRLLVIVLNEVRQ
jgi:hypothetical protein